MMKFSVYLNRRIFVMCLDIYYHFISTVLLHVESLFSSAAYDIYSHISHQHCNNRLPKQEALEKASCFQQKY